jgi:predicted phage terminase large subunit-like protein
VTLPYEVPRMVDIDAERCRRSLRRFVRSAWHVPEPANPFVSGWHLDCIADHLEAVTRGDIRNLLINIPPRHSKSLQVAVFWPCWEWTTNPERRWLFTSYAEKLAIRDSVKCRRLIASPWYQERWGRLAAWREVFDLTDDQNQKVRFENDKTGYRIASSVGGANTGEGGDRIVVDDPHNVEEAESETIRAGVLSWWDEVMSTRGNDPRTVARVVVMQRTHESDLSGHILEQGGYHHLCLPARYEAPVLVPGHRVEHAEAEPHTDCPFGSDPRATEGDLLWPERFDEESLAALEAVMGAYAAAGQLQQRPVPREGALFKSDHLRPLPPAFEESIRPTLRFVQFWDLAFSEKASADHTAAVTLGIDRGAVNAYVTHVLRKRIAEESLIDAIVDHVVLTRPLIVGVEEGAYKQAATRDLVRQVGIRLAQKKWAVPILPVKTTTDKVFRAQLPANRAALGQVYCDRGAPWWPVFEQELLKFPKGASDDQVDALSGALQLAIEQGMVPPKPVPYGIRITPEVPRTADERALARTRANLDAWAKTGSR